jgi:hypothetical protein
MLPRRSVSVLDEVSKEVNQQFCKSLFKFAVVGNTMQV